MTALQMSVTERAARDQTGWTVDRPTTAAWEAALA